MPRALLTTKLHAPRTRPALVERPRLREGLDRTETRKLTLVSAPAGFGKTTLLSEWATDGSEGESSVAWLSIDETDNDPTRFLSYLVGALQSVEAGIGEGVLASLRSPELPPVESVVGALVNELSELPHEITVVLDDYHLIGSDTVHEALSFLIEHMPENAHLIISGRTDPPLPLARLRARDQITELRAAKLRFTTEEATTFLKDVMGLTISAGDIASLEEVTEGWVAALQLAALSMRDREDVSGFVEAFSGSNRHVLDFLAEEVLERQPEEVRLFLLKTSVLESMSAPLCDALTGHSDGQAMLERLERENLFVVALDDERRWYRYHHLFADFLRGRLLTGESPELVAGELHLRASGWYEAQGLEVEAIGHALLASEADAHHEVASRLIERGVRGAWSRGEGPTVLDWLEALPEVAKRRRPRLLLQHAQALVLTGRPDEAEPLLREAERAASEVSTEKSSRFLMGFASAVRSWRARLRGDASEAVELARRALSLLPAEEAYLRNFAAVCLGEALWITGDLAAAGAAFAEATEIGRAAGHIYGTLNAMALRARVQAERGRLREAEEAFREVSRFVIEQGTGQFPAAGLVHIGMADITYERDDIDAAERELEMGIGLTERTREVGELVRGYVTLSKVKLARGDEEGAFEAAREAERVARTSGANLQISIAAAWTARLHIARGDLEETAALEQERATNAASGASQAVDRLTSARLLHARGRHDEALRLLKELREAAEAAGRIGTVIEILSLQALALWASNEKEQGVGTLTQALAMAEPEGFVRTFVDEGPTLSELLSEVLQARQRGHLDATGRVSTQYLAKLLAVLAQGASANGANARLAEPVSERELEVLALIAAGETNGEIAGKLFVSISTVKTHINNLYRKLGARSRTQAVARARELGLL